MDTRTARICVTTALMAALVATAMLSGCGGYAKDPDPNGGVMVGRGPGIENTDGGPADPEVPKPSGLPENPEWYTKIVAAFLVSQGVQEGVDWGSDTSGDLDTGGADVDSKYHVNYTYGTYPNNHYVLARVAPREYTVADGYNGVRNRLSDPRTVGKWGYEFSELTGKQSAAVVALVRIAEPSFDLDGYSAITASDDTMLLADGKHYFLARDPRTGTSYLSVQEIPSGAVAATTAEFDGSGRLTGISVRVRDDAE